MRLFRTWFPRRARRPEQTFLEVIPLDERALPAVGFTATGAAAGAAPLVTVFRPDGTTLAQFTAYDPSFHGGVNVAAGNVDGSLLDGDELIVAAGPGGGPHVRVLDASGNQLASFMAFSPTFTGGVSPGAISPNQLTVNSLTGG